MGDAVVDIISKMMMAYDLGLIELETSGSSVALTYDTRMAKSRELHTSQFNFNADGRLKSERDGLTM